MTSTPSVTYDPQQSPTLYRMQHAARISGDAPLTIDDLANNPVAVKFLYQDFRAQLVEIQALNKTVESSQERYESLKEQEKILSVSLGKLEERYNGLTRHYQQEKSQSLIDIPASLLAGYAINLLTSDILNPVGLTILVLGVSMLFLRRNVQVKRLLGKPLADEPEELGAK